MFGIYAYSVLFWLDLPSFFLLVTIVCFCLDVDSIGKHFEVPKEELAI